MFRNRKRSEQRSSKPTITALLAPSFSAEVKTSAEAYRIEWERKNGPTDLTRYYTTRWPGNQADALYTLDPIAYFKGMPPFFQDFLLERYRGYAKVGALDNIPAQAIRVFLHEQMNQGRKDPPRSR